MSFPGHPIFDTRERFENLQFDQNYPSLLRFLHDKCPPGARSDWDVSAAFLEEFVRSPGTFNRFRGEIQRFLLYCWLVNKITLDKVTPETIEYYFSFLKNPPKAWITSSSSSAFIDQGGVREFNPKWRPFFQRKSDVYRVKQSSLDAATRALSAFFRHLELRGHVSPNPFIQARRSKRKALAVKDRNAKEPVRRLTGWQWAYLIETLKDKTDDDGSFERTLFIVITLKALYLRVSELAPREDDTGEVRDPVFGDFQRQIVEGEPSWELYIFGKGGKHRWVTVPDQYVSYLKRYREWLGLSPFPENNESTPIIPKRNGKALGYRQVIREVEKAFSSVAEKLRVEEMWDEAQEFEQLDASTHYLRHTGASMDIESGRPIRHVSEDLGHSSVEMTERIYVNADQIDRYRTGKGRTI